MHLAFITIEGHGLIDDFLSEVVAVLQQRGVRLSGTVRALPVDHRAHRCDMDLRVLPDGPLFRISQPLGAGSRGCRLNGGTIETLAMQVEAKLAGSDLLVVNKFGKQESHGRGLRPAIAKAIDLGVPVLVGVNGLNLDGFTEFAAGMARQLEPDTQAILSWVAQARSSLERSAV